MGSALFSGRVRRLSRILVVLFLGAACIPRAASVPAGHVQTGVASWYGQEFHGRPTSSREIYDMHDMTAAHRTLPFGTQVMVTNLANGRWVVVRINDRGPFVKDRIIDLSYAAARVLGMVGPGTTPVRLEILAGATPPPQEQKFSVQVGSFIVRENAESLLRRLREEWGFGQAHVEVFETLNQTFYRVRLAADSLDAARALAADLADRGLVVLVVEER